MTHCKTPCNLNAVSTLRLIRPSANNRSRIKLLSTSSTPHPKLESSSSSLNRSLIRSATRAGTKLASTQRPTLINATANQQRSISFYSQHSNYVSARTSAKNALPDANEADLDEEPYFSETFRSSEMEIVRCLPGELKPKPSADKLVFGHTFTDHMFRVDWDSETGWTSPLISKVHNIDIHPGAKVLHYALAAFEGAKAFRGHDNKIRLFRLDQNIKRLRRSARRLCLPEFDELELMKCIHKLVQLDQDWIPKNLGPNQLTSLYVRPTILGVDPSLGVANSRQAILYVLLSPVGPYFKSGFKPVSLYADPDIVRAWPGGAGSAKLGANYAPTIMVQKQAEKLGLHQVLWLFGSDMKITEVGTMNVFVSMRDPVSGKLHLITPPLEDGLILPGITRASILELASQWDDVVCEERYLTIDEIDQAIQENRIVEMFGSGTACVVCPINSITLKGGRKLRIPHSDITHLSDSFEDEGPVLTKRILKAITDIQYGKIKHPWATELIY